MNDFCDVALQALAAWLEVAFNKDSHIYQNCIGANESR